MIIGGNYDFTDGQRPDTWGNGCCCKMINLPVADYATAEYLAAFSTDSVDKTNGILDSLISKGYVLIINGKYAVNKEKIPQMARR